MCMYLIVYLSMMIIAYYVVRPAVDDLLLFITRLQCMHHFYRKPQSKVFALYKHLYQITIICVYIIVGAYACNCEHLSQKAWSHENLQNNMKLYVTVFAYIILCCVHYIKYVVVDVALAPRICIYYQIGGGVDCITLYILGGGTIAYCVY